MEKIEDRIQKVLIEEGINSTRFAELIGVQRSSISHILSGRNKPSFDMIRGILTKLPQINPDWLLLGKGNMYRKLVQTSIFDTIAENQQQASQPTNKTKPSENRIFETDIDRVLVFYKDRTFKEYRPG